MKKEERNVEVVGITEETKIELLKQLNNPKCWKKVCDCTFVFKFAEIIHFRITKYGGQIESKILNECFPDDIRKYVDDITYGDGYYPEIILYSNGKHLLDDFSLSALTGVENCIYFVGDVEDDDEESILSFSRCVEVLARYIEINGIFDYIEAQGYSDSDMNKIIDYNNSFIDWSVKIENIIHKINYYAGLAYSIYDKAYMEDDEDEMEDLAEECLSDMPKLGEKLRVLFNDIQHLK